MLTTDHSANGRSRQSIALDAVIFIALLATAIALGAELAHTFALANKIGLSADEYLIAQKAYRGWNQLAYVLLIQLIATLAAAIMSRSEHNVLVPVLFAIPCLVFAQTLFWIYIYPANVATQNWTTNPENWEILRREWEYSHAASAAFQLIAMACLIVAALARGR
jgi:hypothetical protein